jgi:ubiquinone/menaquinone biosynthesis C-methylase UbiE
VVASDLTQQMLDEAAKLAAMKGIANLSTALADAEALPFEDARFDLVTCRIAPHHFPDIPSFVAEVERGPEAGRHLCACRQHRTGRRINARLRTDRAAGGSPHLQYFRKAA